MFAQPATTDPEDVYAADVFNQLHAGTSLNPVVYGDYPQVQQTKREAEGSPAWPRPAATSPTHPTNQHVVFRR